jgi:hypothetical protein
MDALQIRMGIYESFTPGFIRQNGVTFIELCFRPFIPTLRCLFRADAKRTHCAAGSASDSKVNQCDRG